jgi:hypothetical protein
MGISFCPRSRVKKMKERELPANVLMIDVSSRSSEGWNALSPFYDHGGIPVPGMPGATSRTVEGIWQGLKRFELVGEDLAMLATGKPKKRRMGPSTGRILGHVYEGQTVNGAVEARHLIYVPAYTWMVEHCPKAKAKFEELVELARTHVVHVYDFEESGDINSPKPYAHAALLAQMIQAMLKQERVG